jgi:hypothetical protein
MLALIENTDYKKPCVHVISAHEDNGLRNQIERVIGSNLSSTAWAKLYVEMETIDFGEYQITLFSGNSVIKIEARSNVTTLLRTERSPHDLKGLPL